MSKPQIYDKTKGRTTQERNASRNFYELMNQEAGLAGRTKREVLGGVASSVVVLLLDNKLIHCFLSCYCCDKLFPLRGKEKILRKRLMRERYHLLFFLNLSWILALGFDYEEVESLEVDNL